MANGNNYAGLGGFQEQLLNMLGPGADPYSSQSIAASLSSRHGVQITPEMVASFSPEMVKGAQYQTYQPIVELKSESLLRDLSSSLGGKEMKSAHGGFAGSSGAQQVESKAKDIYGKGAADIMKEVYGLQQSGRKSMLDLMNTWRQAVSAIKK